MPATRQELDSFHRFASARFDDYGTDASLEELFALWRRDREYSETVEDVRRGVEDYHAGRGQSLAETFREVRADVGLTK